MAFSRPPPSFTPQRAVETPPHPDASSSGFYASTQPAAGRASTGAAGDFPHVSTYADLRSSRSVPHRCSTLVLAFAVQALSMHRPKLWIGDGSGKR